MNNLSEFEYTNKDGGGGGEMGVDGAKECVAQPGRKTPSWPVTTQFPLIKSLAAGSTWQLVI